MGTYTTNKELYKPSVGETGWGILVNGNFETIDNFLKPISLSGSTYTFTGNQTGGTITATKITNSGTLTNTGKITANGGVGTTSLTTSSTITSAGKITANGGIAGTTGTYSGFVTAKNVNIHGMIPYTLYLFSTNPSKVLYHYTGPSVGSGSVIANYYVSYTLTNNASTPDGGSATYSVFTGLSNDIPAVINDIKLISGSWSNPILKTGSQYITATITGISGTITNTGLTITYAQAISLFNSKHTVTFKNSRSGTSALGGDIRMEITNTSSSTQFYIFTLSGLYD